MTNNQKTHQFSTNIAYSVRQCCSKAKMFITILNCLTILFKRFQIESEVVVTTLKHIYYSPQNPSPIKFLKSNCNPRRAHENSKKRSVVEFEKWAKSVPLSFCHFVFFAPLAASSCVRQTGKQGYKHLQPKHGLKPFSATCYLPCHKHVFWRQVL